MQELIEKINEIAEELEQTGKQVLVFAKGEHLSNIVAKKKWNMGNNLDEVAQNIFTLLRKVDKEKVDLVLIEGVGEEGLGLAITNRLIRACAYHYLKL